MKELSSQGLYDTISSKFVLAGVKMRLQLSNTTSEDMYLTDIINNGIKRLRNNSTMIPTQATIPIYDFKAQLPDGFIKFSKSLPIRLYSPTATLDESLFGYSLTSEDAITAVTTTLGVATQRVFAQSANNTIPIFLNGSFYDGLGGNAIEGIDKLSPYITIEIVNGCMYFSSNCDFPYVKISYLSGNMDENGDLLVPSYCEAALTEFVLWIYKSDNADKYPAYIIQQHELSWKNGKAHCRAIAAMPNSEDTTFIARKNNSLT